MCYSFISLHTSQHFASVWNPPAEKSTSLHYDVFIKGPTTLRESFTAFHWTIAERGILMCWIKYLEFGRTERD